MQNEVKIQNIEERDKLTKTRSIYDATSSEIFWKNFLAGAGRSLGGIIFYLIFILIMGTIFIRVFTPIISPLMNQLNSISGSLNKIPSFPSY